MNQIRIHVICIGLAVVILAAGSPALASNWTFNASGANQRFGWSAGKNNTDHFGNPTVTTAGFFFFAPVNFKAQLGTPSVTDYASVRINTNNALPVPAAGITDILVREWGTFSGQIADFTVGADYSITRYTPSPYGQTGILTMPVVFNAVNNTWYSERWLHVGDPVPTNPGFLWNQPAVDFIIKVTDTIQVASQAAQNGAWISKRGMEIVVPEPSALALMIISGLLLMRRSR
jgi:hypothetical protein